MRAPLRLASPLLALGVVAACSSEERPPGVSNDAGITLTDRGNPTVDRPSPTDTGDPADAGAPTDTGAPTDAGSPVDGGAPSTGARLLAPFSGSIVRSLRPTFRWSSQPGATGYRVEFSTTRAFSAVASSEMVAGTELRPSADLPRGLRWWRVVPLASGGDGPPTAAWPVTIGRARNDIDGDGFADIAIGAPTITTAPPGGQGRGVEF